MRQKKNRSMFVLMLWVVITCCFMPHCFAAQTGEAVKHPRVLFISSYDYDWDSVPKQLTGFANEMNGNAKIDYVFMDTKTHTYDEVKPDIYNLVSDYIEEDGQYNVIVLGDDAALDFALEYRKRLFKDVPIVFEGINTKKKAFEAAEDPLITGIVESFPMEDTVKLAKSFYTDAVQIVAIADDTESCQGSLAQYHDIQADFPDLDFKEIDCSKLTENEIIRKVSSYGEDTILLFLMMSHDAEGYDYSQLEAAKVITRAASIPVFKADELGIEDGILGGVVISYETMGAQAGKMAVDILNGTSPDDIDVITTPSHPMIDENVMDRFNLSTKLLPPDTVLVNHDPSFMERYHKVFVPLIAVIAFLTVIMVLIIMLSRRTKLYYEETHEKDIMVSSLIKNIPGGISIYKIGEKIETLYSSDGLPAMGGRTMEEYQEWIKGDIIEKTVCQEDAKRVRDAVQKAAENNETINIAYRMKHKDGSNVWLQLSATPIRVEDGCPVYYAVFSAMPQEAVLYRSIATESPTGIYICDSENYNMLYANETVTKDVGNSNYTGKKCYEYLLNKDKPCDDCSMHCMKDGEFVCKEYDAYNRHLQLKGKTFDWHGIHAHIEYVTDDTYRYKEQKAKEAEYNTQMELLSKTSERCIGNFRLNITKNIIENGYGENLLDFIGIKKADSMEGLIENARSFIPNEEEWKRYAKAFSRESLLKSFESDSKTVSLDHHMLLGEKTSHWCRSRVVMTQNPTTNDVEGYIYAEDINANRLRKAMMEATLQKNRQMLIGIDAVHNTHTVFDSSNAGNPAVSENSEGEIISYVEERYSGENKQEVIRQFRMSTVLRELADKDKYNFFIPLTIHGSMHYEQVTYFYLDKESRLVGLMVTDITEIYNQQREQEEELERALAQAQSANIAKTEFLARMSHDMRTPMNGILGLSYIMEEETDIDKIKKELLQLRGSGEYLLQLINDVLDVNKIESRKFELYPKVCDEKEVFDEIISIVKPQIGSKAIEFNFEKHNIEWQYMMMDAQRVKQIFVNLLSNAVKFTPYGGRIDFIMEMVSENEGVIRDRFIIRDNGIGMAEEFLSRVFEPFAQENRVKQDLGGTGLGLPIVKKLAELMGGSISVKSKVNEGSEFTLYLNFPVAKPPEDKKIESMQDISPLKGARILLCEDHPLNAQIATRLLARKGANVTWKENGRLGAEEFERSETGYYDAVLMDIRMPEMNGIEAAKAIRSLNRIDAKNVPIIAMTANAYKEDVEKSLKAGMNEHLAKPIDPQRLYETVAKYIKERK